MRLVIFTACCALIIGIPVAHAERPLSIDDILRLEGVGRVIIAPSTTHSLIYEWIPPYEVAPNFASVVSLGDRSAQARIHTVDISGRTSSRPLFDQQPNTGYWIGGLSPNGAYLAIYSLNDEGLKAGVFNLHTRKLIIFQIRPNYSWLVQSPVWVSDDLLIYSTLAPDQQAPVLDRHAMVFRLAKLWEHAFAGTSPTATVLSSARSGIPDESGLRSGSLVEVDARNGNTRELAPGYFYNLRRAPGGRYLAGLREGGPIQPEPDVAVTSGPSTISTARKELAVIDLVGGAAFRVPCSGCDVILGTLRWSKNGSRLSFLARRLNEGLEDARLYEYRPADAALINPNLASVRFACRQGGSQVIQPLPVASGFMIFAHPASTSTETRSGFSPGSCEGTDRDDWYYIEGGRRINLTAGLREVSDHPVGMSRNAIFVVGDGQLWRLGSDGSRRSLTAQFPHNFRAWGMRVKDGRPSEEAMLTGDEIGSDTAVLESDHEFAFVHLDRGFLTPFKRPSRAATLVAVADSANIAVFKEDTRSGLSLGTTGSSGVGPPIVELNRFLSDVRPSTRTSVRIPTLDGSFAESCLLLPGQRKPGERLPLILILYPGATGDCDVPSPNTVTPVNYQLLVANGYAVLFVAAPSQLIRTTEGPTRGLTPLVLAAVDETVHEGYVDSERLGLFGQSQGQENVLRVLTETDRFKAAIVLNGLADFGSHYGSFSLRSRLSPDGTEVGNYARYEDEASDNWLGGKPWEEPTRYSDNSPLLHAERINTPLLIFHSDFDLFPLGQSEELFSALYRLRREATYVTYWGEGHVMASPANIRDMWKRIFNWYDRYLHVGPSSQAREPGVPRTPTPAGARH